MRFGLACLLAFEMSAVAGKTVLMDTSGSLNRQIPSITTSNGVVAVVSSPGTPSLLTSSSEVLSLEKDDGSPLLSCRGATLSGTSASERASLATTSIVAGSIMVDGITEGDVEAGLRYTRHARTLTALFRARLVHPTEGTQSVILCVAGPVSEEVQVRLKAETKAIFDAASVEDKDGSASLADVYDIQVVSMQSQSDANEAMILASEAARSHATPSTLNQLLSDATSQLRESGVSAKALDPPQVAQAFLSCRQAYAKQARTARAKLSSWKGRVSRGLSVDSYGNEAESLIQRTLQGYDTETLAAAGLPVVAPTRLELRGKLQALVESGLRELHAAQASTLERTTLKKFNAQLLKKVGTPQETDYEGRAALMRGAAFAFETAMSDLDIPSLALTKANAIREVSSKLNDALESFPDSPAAQIKRMKGVTKTTNKERKPGERSMNLGLDLVAMIRPDGFGSLQGFCGYSLGDNSITVGVHNDADDPQVVSQFGGVRPPLLRVQPKLKVDVEL